MIIYKSFKKSGFSELAGCAYSFQDLMKFDNASVVKYENKMVFCGIEIPQQNDRGFVSVKHIKEFKENLEKKEKRKKEMMNEMMDVENLMCTFETTINSVLETINFLKAGRRIPTRLDNALDLIIFNQKEGSKNWFRFLEYSRNLKNLEI